MQLSNRPNDFIHCTLHFIVTAPLFSSSFISFHYIFLFAVCFVQIPSYRRPNKLTRMDEMNGDDMPLKVNVHRTRYMIYTFHGSQLKVIQFNYFTMPSIDLQ